jgi:hypothetical protein
MNLYDLKKKDLKVKGNAIFIKIKHSTFASLISYFKYTQHNKFMIGLGSYFIQKKTTSDCIAFHLEVIEI